MIWRKRWHNTWMKTGVEVLYIEELKKAIEERGLDVPPFYGLALDDESADMEQIISDFRAFVKSIA